VAPAVVLVITLLRQLAQEPPIKDTVAVKQKQVA
jgi:hypothetical protein